MRFENYFILNRERKRKMANVCKCDYCHNYIEYDESDYEVAFGVPNQIYITCPVCGMPITVGVADYPQLF